MTDLKTIHFNLIQSEPFQQVAEQAAQLQKGETLSVNHAQGSLLAFIAAHLHQQGNRQIVVISSDSDKAEKLRDDCALIAGQQSVLFFGERPAHDVTMLDLSSPLSQIETLQSLSKNQTAVIVASPNSIAQKVPAPGTFVKETMELSVGDEHNFQQLTEDLSRLGFEKKNFVESYGDFAVRGGILDVFSFVGENPLRFEFWGNTIDSIREFDVLSQRSIRKLEKATVVPSFAATSGETETEGEVTEAYVSSLFDYLDDHALIILDEPELIRSEIEELFKEGVPGIFSYDEVIEFTGLFCSAICSSFSGETFTQPRGVVDFLSTAQPSFNGSINTLVGTIAKLAAEGYSVLLTCDTKNEASRLSDLIDDVLTNPESTADGQSDISGLTGNYRVLPATLHSGFVYHPAKIAMFTEHEIFGRLRRRGTPKRKRFKGFSQKEVQQLKPGDFVVHADRGVGMFSRMQKITVAGYEQEVMKLEFDEGGILYVNLQMLNRVQKYSSKEGFTPKLNKLGSGDWEKVTSKAKKRIKDIARDLIKLYAKRKLEVGYAFNGDSHWQRELEASFMYEDTPDQARTTIEVKRDMENTAPMDRLVCGDVGFGKTEIAVRAAFKAVSDGKQAAVLVPTTILAMQHYNTFVDRLSKYTVRVEHLTRFKSTKEQKLIIEGVKRGSVDIIIGTHRMLSKDMGFKDLGLLIIDEEHRFGVSAKEKLRQFRASVDTLALTATPIPRTLQFSLLGARDLSVIGTPPRNRLPIQTELVPAGSDGKDTHRQVIREAIIHEMRRGGQIYFVHDRVENIEAIADQIRSNVPEAKVHIAHGQMEGHELEQTIMDFLEKKYDILVCTKIIESGLDIPSVNTIIINRADRFGMAELHQLRGRVGRSNVQAYAYLLVPPLSVLPKPTLRRLQAIEEFTELGSGFSLSMRDLEIRGAGNLLGAEQSGFVADMGFEMYEQILREAVEELKQEEFKELFKESDSSASAQAALIGKGQGGVQTSVETDADAYIPDFYIESAVERLDFYRRLTKVQSEHDVQEMRDELRDRFGEYPDVVEHLFSIVTLRIMGTAMRFQKIELRSIRVTVTLPPETDNEFYGSDAQAPFQKIVVTISSQPKGLYKLEQDGDDLKLLIRIPDVEDPLVRLRETEKVIAQLNR